MSIFSGGIRIDFSRDPLLANNDAIWGTNTIYVLVRHGYFVRIASLGEQASG